MKSTQRRPKITIFCPPPFNNFLFNRIKQFNCILSFRFFGICLFLLSIFFHLESSPTKTNTCNSFSLYCWFGVWSVECGACVDYLKICCCCFFFLSLGGLTQPLPLFIEMVLFTSFDGSELIYGGWRILIFSWKTERGTTLIFGGKIGSCENETSVSIYILKCTKDNIEFSKRHCVVRSISHTYRIVYNRRPNIDSFYRTRHENIKKKNKQTNTEYNLNLFARLIKMVFELCMQFSNQNFSRPQRKNEKKKTIEFSRFKIYLWIYLWFVNWIQFSPVKMIINWTMSRWSIWIDLFIFIFLIYIYIYIEVLRNS